MKHIPVCPVTQRAMKAAQRAKENWDIQISRRECNELIQTLKRHGYNPTPKEKKNEQVSH